MNESPENTPVYQDPKLGEIREAIRKLPFYPFESDSDSTHVCYMESLGTVVDPISLRVHVAKWYPLWTINFRSPGILSPEEEKLSEVDFDLGLVWEAMVHIKAVKSDAEEEVNLNLTKALVSDLNYRMAMCVLMPPCMIRLFFVSEKYGAPINTVWIQAAGLSELF